MAKPFFEQPILNSPYAVPTRHHALDADGQPRNLPPIEGRRGPRYVAPVPPPRKQKGKGKQASLALGDPANLSTDAQAYNPSPIINEIRNQVASWRDLRNPADWVSRPPPNASSSTGVARTGGWGRAPSSARWRRPRPPSG